MVNVDPLEVIDLSNPAEPVSRGILAIDGWVNHIEVRGDKLVTLGVNGAEDRRIAMILFDVSDASAPVELSRAAVGEGWTWTSANHDLKSFRLVDELGLALLPVSSSFYSEEEGYRSRQWVQLFSYDLEAGTVAARGEIDDIRAKRAFVAEDRIMAFSDTELKVVDASNPDAPVVTDALELARDVAGYARFGHVGVLAVQNDGRGENVTSELRIVSAYNPDDQTVYNTLAFDGRVGQLVKLDAHTLAVVGNDAEGQLFVHVVDMSYRFFPRVVGSLEGADVQAYIGRWGGQLMHVGNALAFTEHRWEDGRVQHSAARREPRGPDQPDAASRHRAARGQLCRRHGQGHAGLRLDLPERGHRDESHRRGRDRGQ